MRLVLPAVIALAATSARADDLARARALLRPMELQRTGREAHLEVRQARLRFYVDPSYCDRGENCDRRVRDLVVGLNEVVTPVFGVEMVVESIRTWARGPDGQLGPMLDALIQLDRGDGADWVIGLVTYLRGARLHDELGMATRVGRHFVIRDAVGLGAESQLRSSFRQMPRDQFIAFFKAYRAGKEMAIFVHEWAHTLGIPHDPDPTRIMSATNTDAARSMSFADTRFLEIALRHRLSPKYDPAAEARELIAFVEKLQFVAWSKADRAETLATLRGRLPRR